MMPTPRRFFRRRIVGRVFFCHNCPTRYGAGEGVTKLRWLLLFFFCNRCWRDRRAQCETLMAGACALPTRSVVEPSTAAASPLPSSAAAGTGPEVAHVSGPVLLANSQELKAKSQRAGGEL